MKIQIRRSVFETNSSSVHTLTFHKLSDWEEFKNGGLLMDEYGYLDKSRQEVIDSKGFKKYKERRKAEYLPNDELFDAYVESMGWRTYEFLDKHYDMLEKTCPDSENIAVSLTREA